MTVPTIGRDFRVAAHPACRLGEGPCWFADEAVVRFVDIKGGQIHSYNPASEVLSSQPFAGEPSFIVPDRQGGAVVGSRGALFACAADGSRPRRIAEIPVGPDDRTNDAAVAPDGALWFGSMHDPEREPTGAIWRWHMSAVQRAWSGAIVTNGPAVSIDGSRLYWVDSTRRQVWQAHIVDDGVLADPVVLFEIEDGCGWPDGIVLDAQGCLWVALWDGWAVRRYAPDGRWIGTVAMPCARVTKLCFGGPLLDRAFVTTARIGLSDADLAVQPLAGALFAFDPGVAGPVLPQAAV